MRKARRKPSGAVSGVMTELSGKASNNVPYIEFLGNREAVVDGCKGVLEYTESGIALNAGSCVLHFFGQNLTIRAYAESQTEICGEIQSVEFTK